MAIVLSRVAGKEAAEMLVRVLRGRALTACVHLRGPFTSHYMWEGREVCSDEFEVSATTTLERAWEVAEMLELAHPYELPAVLVSRVTCSGDYGAWVTESCSKD